MANYQKYKDIADLLAERLWLAPSCSLVHCSVDLDQELKLDDGVKSWLAFAKQKCQAFSLLKVAFQSGNIDDISNYSASHQQKINSPAVENLMVRKRTENIDTNAVYRSQSFTDRKAVQQKN
ncbi:MULTISPECIES: hypothetical protein [unclassified Colwellia]|uniref:hypothetical protein n=1 Tax=unclassified Colwellia TaxID=196834 RepID=UPI003855DBD3